MNQADDNDDLNSNNGMFLVGKEAQEGNNDGTSNTTNHCTSSASISNTSSNTNTSTTSVTTEIMNQQQPNDLHLEGEQTHKNNEQEDEHDNDVIEIVPVSASEDIAINTNSSSTMQMPMLPPEQVELLINSMFQELVVKQQQGLLISPGQLLSSVQEYVPNIIKHFQQQIHPSLQLYVPQAVMRLVHYNQSQQQRQQQQQVQLHPIQQHQAQQVQQVYQNHHQQQQQQQYQRNTTPSTQGTVPSSTRPSNHHHPSIRSFHTQPGKAYSWDPRESFPSFVPSWQNIVPISSKRTTNHTHAYKLTLISNKEFTIVPIQHPNNPYDFVPPIKGMRKIIRQITRHSANGEKAVMDGETWRIPLAAYHAFFQYLSNEPNTVVESIPEYLLNVASLGRATSARGFPSVQDLRKSGVPLGLARALAPYQRGGVDFVLQRHGLALIADEMGLGKTVQSIAAMSCYAQEWPLLVLSPSTARFHWRNQFLKWLGMDSAIHSDESCLDDGLNDCQEEKKMEHLEKEVKTTRKRKRQLKQTGEPNDESKSQDRGLLDNSNINVVKSAKGPLLESSNTKVVIASYGLITNLVKNDVLVPGLFKCIIVDESHMLKNKKSKRTKAVLPLLQSATRVIMLSGTPALSRPAELYPQISVLGRHLNVFQNESEFEERYVKDKYSDPSYRELHTMLSNTVMIRRTKEDQLKDIPNKRRENVFVRLADKNLQDQITNGLLHLRKGTGQLGKLSIIYQKDLAPSEKSQSSTTHNPDELNSKILLNQIYKLTGHAKIPIILDMLKQWLADGTNGKLVIFAHHLDVLNSLEQCSGVSNAPGSNTKYIRIDGSTTPQSRQDQIDSFQDDPTIKIALLGITAAGVGVTLTAASTVWFAELFWTPAMMIQAEDRYVFKSSMLFFHFFFLFQV